MFCILWEIEVGEPYSLTRKNDIFSGLGERDGGQKSRKTDEQKSAAGDVEESLRVEEILETIEEEDAEGEDKKPCEEEVAGEDSKKKAVEENLAEEAAILAQELKRAECIVETFRDVKVRYFLFLRSFWKVFPLVGSAADVLKKSHFASFFDGIFVSSRAAHFIQTPLANSILRNSPQKSLIAVETCKYIPQLVRNQKNEFIAKEKEFAEGQGWVFLSPGTSLIERILSDQFF